MPCSGLSANFIVGNRVKCFVMSLIAFVEDIVWSFTTILSLQVQSFLLSLPVSNHLYLHIISHHRWFRSYPRHLGIDKDNDVENVHKPMYPGIDNLNILLGQVSNIQHCLCEHTALPCILIPTRITGYILWFLCLLLLPTEELIKELELSRYNSQQQTHQPQRMHLEMFSICCWSSLFFEAMYGSLVPLTFSLDT